MSAEDYRELESAGVQDVCTSLWMMQFQSHSHADLTVHGPTPAAGKIDVGLPGIIQHNII